MTNDLEILRQALRRLPVPEPRPGFVDQALARATYQASATSATVHRPRRSWLGQFARRWESWAGMALGGAVAAALTVLLLRPLEAPGPQPLQIALALHETRNIDVLIDAERALKDATIRIVASGAVALDGYTQENHLHWRADLERGSNLLSLPVVARSAGEGRLIAVIEHEGRTRRVTIDLTVLEKAAARSI